MVVADESPGNISGRFTPTDGDSTWRLTAGGSGNVREPGLWAIWCSEAMMGRQLACYQALESGLFEEGQMASRRRVVRAKKRKRRKRQLSGSVRFLFVFVRQAEGRDGSGLVLDPEPSAHGAVTLVEKDAAKTQKRPNSRGEEKGAKARGLQFGWQGGDAKRQSRRLLEVGQIAVEPAGAGTWAVRTAGQVAQQLEIGPMRPSAMRAERCRVDKRIALSWRSSWPQSRVYLAREHFIRLLCR